jgi:hypothetical protein
MNINKSAGAEGHHIKYMEREPYWIDGVVLLVGSAIAIIIGCWFVAAGFSAADVSRTWRGYRVRGFLRFIFSPAGCASSLVCSEIRDLGMRRAAFRSNVQPSNSASMR